jgi:hypothetical protein
MNNLEQNEQKVKDIKRELEDVLYMIRDIKCDGIDCNKCPCMNNGYCVKFDWGMVINNIIEEIK